VAAARRAAAATVDRAGMDTGRTRVDTDSTAARVGTTTRTEPCRVWTFAIPTS
jgi:hypothetical protein